MAFGLFRKPVPEPAMPVVTTKSAESAVAQPMAEPDSAREILELLDLELAGLIRQLERAAQSVAGGAARSTATSFAANCRNRRIFNDAAGLAAGQNQRSYSIQSYARDMGGGNYRHDARDRCTRSHSRTALGRVQDRLQTLEHDPQKHRTAFRGDHAR
jgi:hypothetical protein